jgi:hypothetical protein
MKFLNTDKLTIFFSSAQELTLTPCCLLQLECKHGPERTICGYKFSNIVT